MTSGYLKSKNSLIWLQNLQKCEYANNDIFRQVLGHEKFQFFFIFPKAFKIEENHHNMTSGYLKYKYSLIWLQNL